MVSLDDLMIISRSDAIKQGLKHYYTGKPCKHGHHSNRYVSTGGCVSCSSIYLKNFISNNNDRFREIQAAYYERNKEHKQRYLKDYAERNPHKYNHYAGKRRAAKLNATPPWADLEAIEEIYNLASWMTRENGIEYHVDHIEPLQGKYSCGLHVHYNLQIIPATENRKKSNKLRTLNEA